MNDHEAQRIAAAMHELRPDWPTSSLLTLIRKNLLEKPRRDVSVALAWVACESNTASPARVLEAGPWWRAVSVEGGSSPIEKFNQETTCATCGAGRERCRRVWAGDHEFESVLDMRRRKNTQTIDVARTVDAIRAELTPTNPPATEETP